MKQDCKVKISIVVVFSHRWCQPFKCSLFHPKNRNLKFRFCYTFEIQRFPKICMYMFFFQVRKFFSLTNRNSDFFHFHWQIEILTFLFMHTYSKLKILLQVNRSLALLKISGCPVDLIAKKIKIFCWKFFLSLATRNFYKFLS